MYLNKINNNIGFNAMISRDVTINLKNGIDVIPSALIAKLSTLSDKDVYVAKQDLEPIKIQKSILNLLCLELKKGDKVKVTVDETYPKNLFQALISCFESKNLSECSHAASTLPDCV